MTPISYPLVTRLLHWLIALHMIGLIALGWWMVDLGYYDVWYNRGPWLHKAFGLIVFPLGVGLLVYRQCRPSPKSLPNHKPLEKRASRLVHWTLLIAVLTIPVSGYIFTTAEGDGISFFDLFTIPALFPVDDGLRNLAIDFHVYASYGLLALIALHAAGALKHHLIDRDSTLTRMIADQTEL